MKVHGIEITEEQIAAALAEMHGRFDMLGIAQVLEAYGVPWTTKAERFGQLNPSPACRAAGRLLQRERKAGRIRAINNWTWERVEP